MKRSLIFSMIFSILILTACLSPSGGVSAPTVTATQAAPTATKTATATETPSPQSLLPQEVKEKFELAGIDLVQMENAKYDKDGLHITLDSGKVIVLTNTDLQKGIYNGQDNVLQYRDETNQNVIYAFDPESKTFLEASKYIQKDKTDPEKYIQVKDWDELYALWTKEKMFLIPFDPENTYFPPLDKINTDYNNEKNLRPDPEFDYWNPFGDLPDGMESPFRLTNFIIMSAQEGMPFGAEIISEQVFNVDDGTFSVIHFMSDNTEIGYKILQEKTSNPLSFFLPRYILHPDFINYKGPNNLKKYLTENNLIGKDNTITVAKDLISKWFKEGHVPSELERIPTNYMDKSFD